jgi:pyruvate,water dikinase
MSALAVQRQHEYEVNKKRAWPDAIRGGREFYARGADQTPGDGQLAGVPGSPGVVTGRARVICGPEEFHRLEPGEILVAPITNPVWTPLFAIAGGVITEVGGILSHGAIVAREYGIPAVMSIANVTKRVPDGQMLTVDGNRGWVTLGQAGD